MGESFSSDLSCFPLFLSLLLLAPYSTLGTVGLSSSTACPHHFGCFVWWQGCVRNQAFGDGGWPGVG